MKLPSLKSSHRSLCRQHQASSKSSTHRRGVFLLSLGLTVAGFAPFAFANTADNVINGQSDLTSPGTYSAGLPGTGSDVTFTAGAYSPAAFTLNTDTFNLSIGTLDDLSSTALIIQDTAGGTTSTITLNGGSNSVSGTAADLLYVATGGSLNIGGGGGTLNLALAATGNFDIAGTAAISSVISGSGFGFTKTGGGTLTLSGVNTFTGGTTVNAGTLNLASGGGSGTVRGTLTINSGGTVNTTTGDALGYNSGASVTTVNVNAGGVFNNAVNANNGYITSFVLTGGSVTSTGGGAINFNAPLSSLASPTTAVFSAPIILRSNNVTITTAAGTTASGIDLSISGVISQNNGGNPSNITKAGSGTLSLTGANTYTGTTTNTAGTLQLGSASALGTGNYTPSTGSTATTDLNGQTLANAFTNGGNGAVFTNSSASVATISNGYNQAGATGYTVSDFTVQGTGDINWSGAINRTDGYHGTVTKAGTNTLTLSGAGSGYQGEAYTVSGGTLAVNMTNSSSFGGFGITDNANVAGAEATGVTNTISQAISGSGTFTQSGAGTTVLSTTNTFSGGTTVNAGTLNLASGGGSGTILGTLTINSGGTVNTTVSDALGYNGGSSVTTVNVNAGGVFNNAVSGNNGYLANFVLTGGSVTSTGGGGINFANGTGISSLASSTSAVFSAPVVLRQGSMTVNDAAGTTASGIDLTISGVISQNATTGGIIQAGPGVLRLSGANTYTGPTNVNAGTLLVTNTSGSATGTNTVMVSSGATLGGTGTITGAATVNGTLAPGATAATGQVGTLTVGALTLSSTTSALFDVNGASNFDKVTVNGAVVYAGTLTIDLGNYSPAVGSTFQIFSASGTPSGAFTDDASVAFDQAGYSGTFAPSTGLLTITAAVPEPSTWLAGVLSFGTLGFRLRRRLGGKLCGQRTA